MSTDTAFALKSQFSLLSVCAQQLGGALDDDTQRALNTWYGRFQADESAAESRGFVDELIGTPVASWEAAIDRHRAHRHPWYDYIADDITTDEMASFLLENQYYPTFLSMLEKIRDIQPIDDARAAVQENIDDEFQPAPHAELMRRMMLAVKARAKTPVVLDTYSSLIDRTLVFYYGYYVQPWHLVGALFATEHMGTHRVVRMGEGLSRLGLTDEELAFTIVHSECDEHHADDWLARVIIPSIDENSNLLPIIAAGIAECLNSSARYLDYLLDRVEAVEPAAL